MVDWSSFPRIAALLEGADGAPTPTRLGVDVRALLERAIADLADAHVSTDEFVTGLEVVRVHLLEGHSWDAITAARMEAGHPVSARTLRTRQREGLRAILVWATRPEGDAAAVETTADALTTPPGAAPIRLRLPLVAFAAVVLLAVAVFGRERFIGSTPAEDLSPHHVGVLVGVPTGSSVLPAPLPPIPLPYPEFRVTWAMVVVRDGEFALALSVLPSRSQTAFFALWDPATGTEFWRYRLEATADEIMTHDTLPQDAAAQTFWPDKPYFGTWNAHFEDRVLVAHIQPYSPCIVTALDLGDGAELGRYVHPGRLETGLVTDLDEDGRVEAVLAGTDNASKRPAVVVLDPDALRGSASTVRWKDGGAQEDALGRVLLPDLPGFREAVSSERLEVLALDMLAWDPRRGVLTLAVGASTGHRSIARTYQLQLGRDLRPVPGAELVFGESETRTWRQLGLDLPDPATILAGVDVLGAWPDRIAEVTAKKSVAQ